MKLPKIGDILDKQTAIVKEVKNWLALLALIVLAAEVILIIALVATPKENEMYYWYVPLMLFLLLIIVIGFFYDRYLTARSNDFHKLKKIEKKIVGTWWEFMHNHKTITLSIVNIHFNSNQLQFVLTGKSYNSEGHVLASWKSEACAINDLDSPEFHYFWKGIHYSKELLNKEFSGVGVIQFPNIITNKKINEGEGWFTSGNISELKFSGKYKTGFIRCTKDETEILDKKNTETQTLIIQRHSKWIAKFN